MAVSRGVLRARSLGVSGTCCVLVAGSVACLAMESPVSSRPPLSMYPNEPPGFAQLTDEAWNALPPSAGDSASNWWVGEAVANAAIIGDPTAPQSGPNILACHVPAGTHDGVGTCVLDRDDFTQGGGAYYPKLYVSVWVKHSSNWVPHPIGSKMLWFEHAAQSCSGYTDVYSTFNSATMQLGVNEQNCTGRSMLANTGDPSFWTALPYRGVWQRFEFLLVMNRGNQADGVFRMWVDGHLICDYENVRWVPNAADRHLWSGLRYSNVYGGQGGASASQYEYLDHLYVSGGN